MKRLSLLLPVLAVLTVLVLLLSSEESVVHGSGITMIKDKAPLPDGFLKKERPARRFKFIDEAPVVYISGAWFENSETAFEPYGWFDLNETIDLALVFDWFFAVPAVDGGFTVAVQVQGDTVDGKYKAKDYFNVLMSEINPDDHGVLWFRIGQLPVGRYRVKVAMKGAKPVKTRGKLDMAFDVGDYPPAE